MDTNNIVLAEGIWRDELFRVWLTQSVFTKKNISVLSFVKDNSDFNSYDKKNQCTIIKIIQNFCSELHRKWKKTNRSEKIFRKKHTRWLNTKIMFSDLLQKKLLCGRPVKPFVESSDSVKRRKVRQLLNITTQDELVYATRMSLRSSGKRDAANIVKQVTCYSPKRASTIKKKIEKQQDRPLKMTPDEALALYIDTKMTKRQYLLIRMNNKERGADIYPPYKYILSAKKNCYPQDITYTETSAEVTIQSLVNHTIHRLISVQIEVLDRIPGQNKHLKCIFKWGCDGAAGQSRYKQSFASENADDSFLFSMSLVPLRLIAETSNEEIIIWQNRTPSSTKYCRPIKIIFEKESEDFVKREIDKAKSEILNLLPYETQVNNYQVTCVSSFSLTMIDGKICSWLAGTAGQRCHLCGATPSEMNDLNKVVQRPVNEELLSLGMSSLHAWINLFECMIHISYRLEVKKWQVRQPDQEKVKARKRQIQEKFRQKMGLLIDFPKPGFGSTNDGNTARRFFSNSALSSEITGLDENLLKRLNIILTTIVCGYRVNAEVFQKYCLETARLYISLYNWYYMPQSLHKVLIHGGKIVNNAILPIGQMSEEAQEARNKDFKLFREFHSRKFSRSQTMEDVMHMLLVSSDPVISSKRKKDHKIKKILQNEVIAMLESPSTPVEGHTSDEDDDD